MRKKNLFKKLIAAAGAIAMALTLMVPMGVSAADGTGSVTITKYTGTKSGYEDISDTNNWGGSQTISGDHQLLNGVEFTCIKVGERHQIEVKDNGKIQTEMVYTIEDPGLIDVLGLEPNDDEVRSTDKSDTKVYYRQTTLDTKIASTKTAVINYVKNYSGTKTVNSTTGRGTAVFGGLTLQSLYLFAETDSLQAKDTDTPANPVRVTSVSVPFFVSLPFTGKDETEMKDIYAYPKNSTGEAKIEKNITTVGTTAVSGEAADASIGDAIKYEVTYSVPVGENGLESLKVTDKMDDGLTFTKDSSNITVVHQKNGSDTELLYNGDYTVKVAEGTGSDAGKNIITIDFRNYLDTLNNSKISTQKFKITYSAVLNDDAVLGQSGTNNNAELEYTNVGDTASTEIKIPEGETPSVYTYGIDLTKVGEQQDTKLQDVEFTLERKTTDGQYVAVKVKNATVDKTACYIPESSSTNSNIVTTDSEGKIYIRGLEAGTYKLTEKKTNSGYVLLKDPVIIKITRTDNTASATIYNGNNTTNVTMTRDDLNSANSENALVPITVVNNKGFDLPQTGAAGTALFAVAGMAIAAVAGGLLFFLRRSSKK